MRDLSANLWRDLLERHQRLHIYTVDPGADAMASELVPLISRLGRFGLWFADGWSASHGKGKLPAAELLQSLSPGDGLIVGSQTDFSRTRQIVRQAAAAGAATIFVFDHWKNYAAHFDIDHLPDTIVVPDEISLRMLTSALGEIATDRVSILPHLAIEAAADRILSCGGAPQPGTILLLLDPTEPDDDLGYDWRSTLAAVSDYVAEKSLAHVLVKPHPRQNVSVVAGEIEALRDRGFAADLCLEDTECLIARAEEVWGMTTIALNIALAAGRPIRSFQVGRNAAGVRASNPHIEPFVISQSRH
jgi:hypothetical protein